MRGTGRNSSNWETRNRDGFRISISSREGWMLSFYHIKVPAALRVSEQRREGSQRFEVDAGGGNHLSRPADLRVVNPARDFQSGEPRPLKGRATHDLEAVSAPHSQDLNLLPYQGCHG